MPVTVKNMGMQQLTIQLRPYCLNAPWRNFLDIMVMSLVSFYV